MYLDAFACIVMWRVNSLDKDKTGGSGLRLCDGGSSSLLSNEDGDLPHFVLTVFVLSIEAALDLDLSSSLCRKSSLDVLISVGGGVKCDVDGIGARKTSPGVSSIDCVGLGGVICSMGEAGPGSGS